jgi:comEA protein
MRVVRFILGGIAFVAVLVGGGVLIYILSRPRGSTITVAPPPPAIPPVEQTPPQKVATRAEKAVKIDRESRAEKSTDGAKKRGRPPKARDARLDLNTATVAQLEALPRIGGALAQRIIQYRENNGNFTRIEDIQKVSGIGASVVEAIRDLVRV